MTARGLGRCLAFLFVLIAIPADTAAQFVTLGSGSTPISTTTRTAAAVAYDPVHDAYLFVARSGEAVFVDANGNAAGPVFVIPGGASGVSAAYSPDVSDGAGGTGGFLVVGTARVSTDLNAYAQIVAYPGRLVGPQVMVYHEFTPGACGCGINSPSAAYSPTNRIFLVAFAPIHFGFSATRFVRLDLNAQPMGASVGLSGGAMSPPVSAAWNPAANEFGILHGGSPLVFTRVRPDGTIAGETTVGSGIVTQALVVNAARGTYLMATLGNEVQTTEISAAGVPSPSTTIGASPGSTFGLALAYSPVAGTHTLDIGGNVVELKGDGVPTGMSFDTGSWQFPAIAASSRSAKWLVTFASGFLGLALGPRVVERSDFTGDGWPDIIWQHPDTGEVLLWAMTGPFYTGSSFITSGGSSWQVVGSSDFTGDGKPDLLWQDPDSRALMLWQMDGPNFVRSTLLSTGGTDWRVAATGPFTGHGGPDIIWQHPYTGAVLLWKMYGSAYISSTILNTGTLWQIVGAADFTHDGQTDLLWQDPASGALLLWEMNGPTYVSSTLLTTGGTYWKVAAVADYTDDGKPDIVWQQPGTGAVLLWTMDGTTYRASTILNAGGTYWQVKAPQ